MRQGQVSSDDASVHAPHVGSRSSAYSGYIGACDHIQVSLPRNAHRSCIQRKFVDRNFHLGMICVGNRRKQRNGRDRKDQLT